MTIRSSSTDQPISTVPRLLIAGQSSGVGKTTITLGLIAALRRCGLAVQPFKCGPDYIDPSYHTLAAGRPCRNLDTWMLTPQQMTASFERACSGADIAVIEGVMGLFDGSSYEDEIGSSAHIAKLLGAPVLLVLDIGKLARSAGALALGYQRFDPALRLAGFILNRAGSASHAEGCAAAIGAATGLPTPGWLPKGSQLHIPERHLGLIPTGERGTLDELIARAADAIETGFDLAQIVELAGRKSGESSPSQESEPCAVAVHAAERPRLAVARDEAFSFYYPDNLEPLEAAGAEIVFFSPLRDGALPAGADGLYLGGGFPEVYAEQLSRNRAMLRAIRTFHEAGHPIYAECGGFMLLTEALVDLDGKRWPMAGLILGEMQMGQKLAGLGYRVATARGDNLLVRAGESVRGHEFHYSTWVQPREMTEPKHAWTLRRRTEAQESRPDGYASGNLLASYVHVHFGQDAALATRFVDALAQRRI